MPREEKIESLKRVAQEKRKDIGRAIGIDAEFRPLQLVYNGPTGIIVVSVERMSSGIYDRRLFFRHRFEAQYRQLGTPPRDVHHDNVITSLTRPFVYCRATRVTKNDMPGEFSGNWLSVERFDLARQTNESVLSEGGLELPERYVSGWVSQLHGVSSDDAMLFCTCGLQRPNEGDVHHWLCGVELGRARVSLVSRLEGIWY